MMAQSNDRRFSGFIIILIVLILFNGYIASSDILQFGKGIVSHIDKHGVWRSARFARSNNFADYILFLREQIPEDAQVIIPPEEAANWAMSNTPHMQFFLAPREVKNCTTLECGQAFLKQDNTYIMIAGLDTFPGEKIRGQTERIRMHNDTWGVYGPAEGLGNGSSHPYIHSSLDFIRQVAFPLLVIIFILVIGCFYLGWVFPRESVWLRLGMGYGLVLGSFSVIAYFLTLIFPSASLKYLFIVYLGMLGFLAMIRQRSKKRTTRFDLKKWKENFSLWIIIIVGFGVLYGILAVGAGFHATDAIVLWGAKGQGIAYKGFDVIPKWGTNTTDYPLQVPLIIATFTDVFGNSLPISKIIFPLFYVSLALIIFGRLSNTIQENQAALATLAFILSPILVRHARIGYANLPLTYYFVTAVISFSSFLLGSGNQNRVKFQYLSALFFVFAVWTRPEGIWLVLGTWTTFFVVYQLPQNSPPSKLALFSVIVPPIVFWGVWKLTSIPFQIENGIDNAIRGFIVSIRGGDFRLYNLGSIFQFLIQNLISIHSWAIIGLGIILAGFQRIRGYHTSLKQVFVYIHFGLISLFIVIGMYYVFAFDPDYGVQWWLGSGFNRMALPSMTMIWMGLILFVFSSAKTEVE